MANDKAVERDGAYAGRPGSLHWLLHNTVIHPLSGLLWFLGFERAGDNLHEWHHEISAVRQFHAAWWSRHK